MSRNKILNFEKFQSIVKALEENRLDVALNLFENAVGSSFPKDNSKSFPKETDLTIAIYVMESLLKEAGYQQEAARLLEQADYQRSFTLMREPQGDWSVSFNGESSLT